MRNLLFSCFIAPVLGWKRQQVIILEWNNSSMHVTYLCVYVGQTLPGPIYSIAVDFMPWLSKGRRTAAWKSLFVFQQSGWGGLLKSASRSSALGQPAGQTPSSGLSFCHGSSWLCWVPRRRPGKKLLRLSCTSLLSLETISSCSGKWSMIRC